MAGACIQVKNNVARAGIVAMEFAFRFPYLEDTSLINFMWDAKREIEEFALRGGEGDRKE
jgi:hypothetical protein